MSSFENEPLSPPTPKSPLAARSVSGWWWPGSVRETLLLLIVVAVIPLVLLQAVIYAEWFLAQRANELLSNREVAQGIATAFGAFVRDVSRQNAAIVAAVDLQEPDYLEDAARVLDAARQQYPAISAWYLLDAQGRVMAAARAELIGRTSAAAQEALAQLAAGKETLVTDLFAKGVRDPGVFVIGHRFEDEDQRFSGAVVAEIEAAKLGDLALTLVRVKEGRYSVFDSKGILVFTSPSDVDVARDAWRVRDTLLDEALRTHGDVGGVDVLPYDSRPRFTAWVMVPGLGWVVGASRPVDVAMAPAYDSLRLVTGLNLVIIVLSGLGALLVGRRIVGRLALLREHAQALGAGQLGRRVAIGGLRELAELGEHFNDMAQRLQQRSLEVEQAMEDLARSNRELEQFAYVASHDLQEPLRVITGYLQLIERRYRDRLDEDGVQFIDYVVEAVARMQQLIADLLQYSRVGTRGCPMARADLEEIFCYVEETLGRSLAESGVRLTHDPLPAVTGDATQLAQLLQNLVANAVKFRGEHEPAVHVSAEPEGGLWRISVRDNGIGIERQYWDKIFVIFQRLHTRQKYPGTGIGLAICKRIVERHGGHIWLESEPGKGTTFHFTLPQAAGAEPGLAKAS